MKKFVGVLAFFIIFSVAFVSAGPVQGVQQLLDGFREILYLVVEFLFDLNSDMESYDEYFTTKVILGIIIYLIVYTTIKKNSILGPNQNKNPVNIIISFAISLLAIRYLPNEFVEAILLPYTSLGITLTVFLPLLIVFFFLHQSGIGYFGRRAGWLVFGVSLISLWWSRYDVLESANWIYWIGIGFVFICLIFDNKIHRYFGLHGIRKLEQMNREQQHRHWRRQLFTLEEDYRNGILGSGAEATTKYNREKAILDQRIRDTAP